MSFSIQNIAKNLITGTLKLLLFLLLMIAAEFSTAKTEIKSREETRITSTKDTNDTKLFTKPPAAKPPGECVTTDF